MGSQLDASYRSRCDGDGLVGRSGYRPPQLQPTRNARCRQSEKIGVQIGRNHFPAGSCDGRLPNSIAAACCSLRPREPAGKEDVPAVSMSPQGPCSAPPSRHRCRSAFGDGVRRTRAHRGAAGKQRPKDAPRTDFLPAKPLRFPRWTVTSLRAAAQPVDLASHQSFGAEASGPASSLTQRANRRDTAHDRRASLCSSTPTSDRQAYLPVLQQDADRLVTLRSQASDGRPARRRLRKRLAVATLVCTMGRMTRRAPRTETRRTSSTHSPRNDLKITTAWRYWRFSISSI